MELRTEESEESKVAAVNKMGQYGLSTPMSLISTTMAAVSTHPRRRRLLVIIKGGVRGGRGEDGG